MLKKTVKSSALQDLLHDDDSGQECEDIVNTENKSKQTTNISNDDHESNKSAKLRESNQLDETQVVNDFAMEIFDTLDLPANMRT